jgi:hypothetical protein
MLQRQQLEYKTPSPLNISTYTIITDITNNKKEIDLHILSRLIPIYDENSIQTQGENGCIIGINNYTEYKYTDMPRGKIDIKKKYPKSVFNNQLTILYKYYNFKTINIKIFNGKLHLTGIKDYPWEVNHIGNYIINMLKTLKYNIYMSKRDFVNNKLLNYVLYYNKEKNEIEYYRNNIENYNIEKYINNDTDDKFEWLLKDDIIKITDAYLKYIDTIDIKLQELANKIFLNNNYTVNDRKEIYAHLSFYNKLKKIKTNIINYENNKLKQYLHEHINYLMKVVKKYRLRIEQINYTDQYIISKLKTLYPNIIKECETFNNNSINDNIETKPLILIKNTTMNDKYFKISNIAVNMIKSEFNNGMGHKLVNFSNKLREEKYNIFNTYNPNTGHAGILIKFYYNKYHLDKKPGLCHCKDFCINKKIKNIDKCTCLTIIVFRPANITITGGKTIDEIKYAYQFINKFIKDNINDVCYNINQVEIADNKRKKIIKKKPMYININNITY